MRRDCSVVAQEVACSKQVLLLYSMPWMHDGLEGDVAGQASSGRLPHGRSKEGPSSVVLAGEEKKKRVGDGDGAVVARD